jgi:hypothetical protein
MLCKTFTLAALFSAALATPADLVERSCASEYLPTLWIINSQTSSSGNAHTGQSIIYRGSGPTKGFTDTLVQFKVPTGSYGCQFELDYKPGHGVFNNEKGDAQRVNVYAITGEIPASPTWANVAPITGNLVGTFQYPAGNALNQPKRIVINSFQCSPTMRFRLSMNEQPLGYISNTDDATSGFRMTHNC